MRKLLLVDDDPLILKALVRVLSREYRLWTTTSPQEVSRLLEEVRPDGLIVDFVMPGLNGADVLRVARMQDPQLLGILLTGHDPALVLDTAGREGAEAVALVMKPFEPAELRARLAQLFEVRETVTSVGELLAQQPS